MSSPNVVDEIVINWGFEKYTETFKGKSTAVSKTLYRICLQVLAFYFFTYNLVFLAYCSWVLFPVEYKCLSFFHELCSFEVKDTNVKYALLMFFGKSMYSLPNVLLYGLKGH